MDSRVRETQIKDLEEALHIDQNDLDQALLSQPDCFYRVARELSFAVSRRDEAKQKCAEVEAEIDAVLRRDAELSGDKITEKAIESQKRLDRKVLAVTNTLAVLNRKVGEWTALRDAYSQRSYVLKELVALYTVGYFGGEGTRRERNEVLRDTDVKRIREEQTKMRRRL